MSSNAEQTLCSCFDSAYEDGAGAALTPSESERATKHWSFNLLGQLQLVAAYSLLNTKLLSLEY